MVNGFPHAVVVAATVALLAGHPPFAPRAASAQDGWKAEFETACAGTDTAMSLPPEELKERIARCDRLKSVIEAEEESTRKVYLRRLKMCRDLYRYLLDSRK